jgi:hypothetical protein
MQQPLTLSRRRLSRGLVLGGAGTVGLALAPRLALADAATYSEDVSTIINIAATAEALAVTLTGTVIANAAKYDGGKGLPGVALRWVKGIQAEEEDHYKFLIGAGAKPLTLTFTVPQNLANITTNSQALLRFVVAAEGIFIAAYLAAAQEFTQLGKPDLAKIAYEIGGVECEHRVLAAATLKGLGLLGADNPAATLPYADFVGSIDDAGVEQQTPSGVS